MITWELLLASLRTDMGDTSENPRLKLAQAYHYLKFAIRDYSTWNPYIKTAEIDVDQYGAGTLPTDYLGPIEVRNKETLVALPSYPGRYDPPSTPLLADAVRWWTEGGTIRFSSWADSPDRVVLLYKALHPVPEDENDSDFTFTFPIIDEEAILLYIRAKEMGTVRSRTAKLDRYKSKISAGNTRTDNPTSPEENNLMDEYLAIMRQRYGSSGAIILRSG